MVIKCAHSNSLARENIIVKSFFSFSQPIVGPASCWLLWGGALGHTVSPCFSTNNLVVCCRWCFKMLNNQTLICILIVNIIYQSSQLLKIVRPSGAINSQICDYFFFWFLLKIYFINSLIIPYKYTIYFDHVHY